MNNPPVSHHIVTLEIDRADADPLAARLEDAWDLSVIHLERPGTERMWLEVYLEDPAAAELIRAVATAWPGVHATTIRRETPRDWQTFWRHHFHPTNIGRRLRIVPVWEQDTVPPAPDRATLLLDPGLSFGTGEHFTTRFCLERIDALTADHPIHSFLDVGTGSGILAMAAARLGIPRVAAFDHDAIALEQARENLALNHLAGHIDLSVANVLETAPAGSFDLVCANVYTTILIAIAPALRACAGRYLVLSGIRDPELDDVAAAYAGPDFEEIFRDGDGEWGGLAFRRITKETT
jgi:ribosomal protein L11 methyltransferase